MEPLYKFLKDNKNNSNIKAIFDYAPEIFNYWGIGPKQAIVNTVSSGSTYDPEKATIPFFSNIPMGRRNISFASTRSGSFSGTHFSVSSASISKQPFISQALSLNDGPSSGMFYQFYLMNSNTVFSANNFNYTDHQSSPKGFDGYWYSAFGYTTNNNLIWTSELSKIIKFNFSPYLQTDLFSGVTINSLVFFCILYDGYNLWIGRSTSINNPNFTWYKLGSFLSVFPQDQSHLTLFHHKYRYTYLDTTGQNMILSSTNFTGTLPWT